MMISFSFFKWMPYLFDISLIAMFMKKPSSTDLILENDDLVIQVVKQTLLSRINYSMQATQTCTNEWLQDQHTALTIAKKLVVRMKSFQKSRSGFKPDL